MTIEGKEYCCPKCESCFIGFDFCPDCSESLEDDTGIRAEDDCEEDK